MTTQPDPSYGLFADAARCPPSLQPAAAITTEHPIYHWQPVTSAHAGLDTLASTTLYHAASDPSYGLETAAHVAFPVPLVQEAV